MTEKNPRARRAYRILGIVHGVLFGVGVAARGIMEGDVILGPLAGVVVGGLFFAVFWRLAEDHYRGNVPGKPGALIHRGDNDE